MFWKVCMVVFWCFSLLPPVLAQGFDGEAYFSFAPFTKEMEPITESDQGVAGGIVFYYLPLKRLVVGYRVSIVEPEGEISSAYWKWDPRYSYPFYYCDFPAQYVPDAAYQVYLQGNPQGLTLKGLIPGRSYQVVVTPLCIWPRKPYNLDEWEKPFFYGWLHSRAFGWVYRDGSDWGLVMSAGPGREAKRGYFEVNEAVFEGRVEAKKPVAPGGKYSPK